MLSRGIRNNNPGNIRHSSSPFRGEVRPSTDPAFKQFESMEWGYRAMFLVIHNYDQLYGINTLDRIIRRWAPAVENDTHAYIRAVANRLGVSSSSYIDSLNHDTMTAMVGAMSRIENGVAAVEADVEAGWALFAEGRI
ncbi:MAG: structural protein P5 [Rikenellaceae bacterium]